MKKNLLIISLAALACVLVGCSSSSGTENEPAPKGAAPSATTAPKGALPPEQRGQRPPDGTGGATGGAEKTGGGEGS
ncbi:MAG: hypothetical protein JST35_02510 [Armatimonadetes bacterium]|nr:hypothetical protein [Armatimonadota bacterium]